MRLPEIRRLVVETVRWRGRASRKTFYISIGLAYLMGFVTLPVQLAVLEADATLAPVLWAALALPLVALGVGAALYLLGAFVRRLHDRGRAAWWLIIFFGPHILLLALLFRLAQSSQHAAEIVFFVGGAIDAPFLAWGMVEIFLLAGQPAANRFGPDPRENSGSQLDRRATA